MQYTRSFPAPAVFDVVIVGAGASGLAAAVSARKMGADVLLIDKAPVVGGNMTVGHITTLMGGYGKNTMADRINCLLKDGRDPHLAHDPEDAKIKLTALVSEKTEVGRITQYLDTSLADVTVEGDMISALILATQSGLIAVSGKVFVDATGDGVLSALAGEKIEIGREDGLTQPLSIMFTIDGVDPMQTLICEHEEMDTVLAGGSYFEMTERASKTGELPPTVGIVRLYRTVHEGERLVNATQVNRLNSLNPLDYTRAQAELREQMNSVVRFLRKNVEGFENIRIKDSSDAVGVRESRRTVGQYLITAEDLLAGQKHSDCVVHNADFPIDIHNPNGAGQSETKGLPHKAQPYDIPYRALLPLKNKNLLLSGRCISGTHRAHASYRVMNIALNIGEAVGIASALSAKYSVSPAEVDVREIQKILASRGIELWD